MSPVKVPFFRPHLTEGELQEVLEVLRSGWLTTGPRVRRFEQLFASAVGGSHAVAVNSGTAALHLAVEALRLKAGEAVLVPSRSESFGLVALEAQACGTPVIAAAAGGLRYVVVDGKTGFLVEGHDPDDYADRILAILRDPGLAERLSLGAIGHAGRFSWDATTSDIRDVYREVLGP